MRVPRHVLGFALLPLFPHAATTLPTPLPPRPLFRHLDFLRRIRFYHFLAPPKNEDTGRCRHPRFGGLVLDILLAFDIRSAMDEEKV